MNRVSSTTEPMEDSESPASPPKRRTRLPSSCLVCRKRKIRCNKARPSCDQCLAAGIGHLCHYEEPNWLRKVSGGAEAKSSSTEADGKVPTAALEKADELSHRIKQLESAMRDNGVSLPTPEILSYDPSEKVKFVDSLPFLVPFVMRKSRIEFHGCMSPIFDIKMDPYLKIIWLNMWKYVDIAMQSRSGSSQDLTPINFQTSALNNAMLEFLKLRRQKVAFKKLCEKRLRNPTERLNEILLENLPEKRTIIFLLDIFFRKVYPLLPVMNRQKLIHEEIDKIVGGWTNMHNKPTVIHISDAHDVAVMGMLFALMAISCLTISDSDLDEGSDLEPLKNMCPAIFAQVSQCCLEHERALRKSEHVRSSIVVMLLKFYNMHCPEDDTVDDLAGGKIQTGLMLTLARSKGVFADLNISTKYTDTDFSDYYRVWRRFWHSMMSVDAIEAVIYGTLPRYTDDQGYDTELPTHEVGESTTETAIISDFGYLDRQTKLFRKLAVALYQRKNDPTIEKTLSLIDELKQFTERELGSLSNILKKNTDPCMAIKQVGYLLDLYALESGLRQRCITHFWKTKNSTMVHKQFLIQLGTLTRMYQAVMNCAYNTENYFGSSYHFYLRPKLLNAATRVIMSLGTLVGRCTQSAANLSVEEQARVCALRDLKDRITDTMAKCVELIVKVNYGYYNAQKGNIGFSFFVTMLQDPAFDFDKAQQDVWTKMPVSDEIKSYYFHGRSNHDLIEQNNFLDNLLVPELEFITTILPGDISEIVQPLFQQNGHRVYVDPRKPLFVKKKYHLSNHFGDVGGDTSDLAEEAELNIQKAISMKYMVQKVDSIFAGSDTITTSNVTSPAQLAGMIGSASVDLSEQREDGDVPVTVTSEEFGDLFGLFEDLNWANIHEISLEL